MTPDQVRNIYDQRYAENYNRAFRDHPLSGSLDEDEFKILTVLLTKGGPWLDVGCGNGKLLSRFPQIDRVGLDLSPAMLEVARRANPTTTFVEGNFLDLRPEWADKFRIVTCTGHAYGLVDSMREIEVLLNNMADWTSKSGAVFIAVSDPRDFAGNFPERQPWWDNATVRITSITWDYEENLAEGNKVHKHTISPTVETMEEMLRSRFSAVSVIRYGMLGLLATKKK